MIAALYPTKKALKESIGKMFKFRETSIFRSEFTPTGMMTVVGPSEHERKWYANVWCDENYIITKVK